MTRLERRTSTKSYRWYDVLHLPCGGLVPHQHRVLRQIPPGTATFARPYGYSPDIESLNALIAATWRNKRIIAYGAARQTLAALGFAHTQNAIARFVYLKRQGNEAADTA